MILDLLYDHNDFFKILPFIRNGIIIDTSVLLLLLVGLIDKRFTSKYLAQYEYCLQDYEILITFLDRIKHNNKFNKFIITPHILSETLGHISSDLNKDGRFKLFLAQILPIVEDLKEKNAKKEFLCEQIKIGSRLKIEIGDLSIFVITDQILTSNKKISILVRDKGFIDKFEYHPDILVMYFDQIKNHLLTMA